jgi:hypothetical protein
MYQVVIETLSGEVFEVETETLSSAVMFATNTAKEGDRVRIFSTLNGLCGPEVQDLILEYIEDGWESYDS